MPTIKLSDTEVLQVIHHINNLDMAKHLAQKLQQAINAPVPEEPKHKGYQLIWEALGMQLSGNPTIDKILTTIEHNKDTAKQRNDNLSERFNLLEALRAQLAVQNWDQMSGAVADLKKRAAVTHDHTDQITRQKIANALGMQWMADFSTDDILAFIKANCTTGASQAIKELRRDLEKEVEVSKYLRDCLKEIGTALNQTNLTPASITETALVYIQTKETTEHPDTYRVRSIKYALTDASGHKYPDVIRRIKDIVELDTPVPLDADLLEARNKLAIAERKLSEITDIFNERPRSGNDSEWSRIAEILARHPSPLQGVRP